MDIDLQQCYNVDVRCSSCCILYIIQCCVLIRSNKQRSHRGTSSSIASSFGHCQKVERVVDCDEVECILCTRKIVIIPGERGNGPFGSLRTVKQRMNLHSSSAEFSQQEERHAAIEPVKKLYKISRYILTPATTRSIAGSKIYSKQSISY
jgi:hypothetical protein